jgi:transcriptional regulator with XRE-family HTH domain
MATRALSDRSAQRTLGAVMRGLRARFGWTLKEMSAKSGIPVSTLSKVEHDRLTLTYDKLQQLSHRLNISMSELFAEEDAVAEPQFTARRSIGRLETALRVTTPKYDHFYLCTELRRKRMIPIIVRICAHTSEEFGSLHRHDGEDFVYVIKGRVEVQTEFYDPVILEEGESIYLDSTMGHAYLAADGCDEALVLSVCSAGDDEALMDSLVKLRQPERRKP